MKKSDNTDVWLFVICIVLMAVLLTGCGHNTGSFTIGTRVNAGLDPQNATANLSYTDGLNVVDVSRENSSWDIQIDADNGVSVDAKTGTNEEVWKLIGGNHYLYKMNGYSFGIDTDYTTEPYQALYYTEIYSENPDPTSGSWYTGYNYSEDKPTGTDPVPSVTKFQVTMDEEVPKTWDGYKAILTDGVYSFEETLTTGLTYGTSYVPVVGGIYSADTVIRVSGIYMPGVWTSPDNLTANDSNPDFIVDQSSSYSSGTVAFNAFDGSLNVGNYGSGTYNSSDYVDTAWISIELADIKKVNYLKLISAGYSDGCQPASFNFEYSDDGSTWTPCLEVRGLTKAWWNTPSVGTEHEWAVELDSAHPYYRLNMLSRTDGVSYNIQRMEIGYKA